MSLYKKIVKTGILLASISYILGCSFEEKLPASKSRIEKMCFELNGDGIMDSLKIIPQGFDARGIDFTVHRIEILLSNINNKYSNQIFFIEDGKPYNIKVTDENNDGLSDIVFSIVDPYNLALGGKSKYRSFVIHQRDNGYFRNPVAVGKPKNKDNTHKF